MRELKQRFIARSVRLAWTLPLLVGGIVAAASFALTGCTACTLVGCTSTLTLQVTDSSGTPVPFQGEVSLGDNVLALDCTGQGAQEVRFTCENGGVTIRGHGQFPAAIGVALTTADGAKAFEGQVMAVSAQSWYPNGQDCDDGCETAQAEVVLQ